MNDTITRKMRALLERCKPGEQIWLRGRGECRTAEALDDRGLGRYLCAYYGERRPSFTRAHT